MKFVDALQQQDTVTENGMATNSSSLSSVVDLFFNIGAMRGKDKARLIANFSKAFNEDPTRALKILFWARDIRGGAGERQIFRDIIEYLAQNHTAALNRNLEHVSEFGRWDDLLTLVGTPAEGQAFSLIQKALLAGDGLCAKWMPRKGLVAVKLRSFMRMTPKQYRKTLVSATNVVETKMCANEWDSIEFGKLPSLAAGRYIRSFHKHTPDTYKAYVDALVKGEAKINAGAAYPYDVTKLIKFGQQEVADAQWAALPNWMEGANDMVLPVVDVSGSMGCPAGGNPNVTCMDVAISLGLYISERNEGPFKDAFITFSGRPSLQVLKGSLTDRFRQLQKADWAMNTNLEATFKLILDQAVKHNLKQEDMPGKILILSDMEFDEATRGYVDSWGRDGFDNTAWNPTAQQMIEEMYQEAGYKVPSIVYWNLQSRNKNVPVSFDQAGTALVSGFSPAIMTSLLAGEIESPQQIMDVVIMAERYSKIK
jgi:hypothetical protein